MILFAVCENYSDGHFGSSFHTSTAPQCMVCLTSVDERGDVIRFEIRLRLVVINANSIDIEVCRKKVWRKL